VRNEDCVRVLNCRLSIFCRRHPFGRLSIFDLSEIDETDPRMKSTRPRWGRAREGEKKRAKNTEINRSQPTAGTNNRTIKQ